MATPYHTDSTLLTLPLMQHEVESSYFEHVCSFINWRLLVPAWKQPGNMTQVCTTSCISDYYVLLLVDMDCNCTRTGFEVYTCAASLPCRREKFV